MPPGYLGPPIDPFARQGQGQGISYTQDPGGFTLRTETPGLPELPGGPTPDFQGLLERKLRMAEEEQAARLRMQALQEQAMRKQMTHQLGREGPALDWRMAEAQTKAAEAQAALAKRATKPLPRKNVTIGGFTGSLPDTEQLPVGLLPQGAGLAGPSDLDKRSMYGQEFAGFAGEHSPFGPRRLGQYYPYAVRLPPAPPPQQRNE